MSKIAHQHLTGIFTTKKNVEAKLWPNGEVVIWKTKTYKPAPLVKRSKLATNEYKMSLFRLQLQLDLWQGGLASALGLSPLPIFDSVSNQFTKERETFKLVRKRKGLSGITSYGRRMVKNAAHVLQERYGRARCIFATVTIPSLPIEQMAILHENWHQLVEYYRLGISRKLKAKHLRGEIVTVSEVQDKRYKRTGLPVLHLHSVFVGVYGSGQYAISTEEHDDIWVRAVNSVVRVNADDFSHAGNLQRVRKCAGAYLGKYMTKGVKCVSAIVDAGLGAWLPKHWWNCSRSLAACVKSETRVANGFADWLNDMANAACDGVWEWHRDVLIEMADGQMVPMAKFGRLKPMIAGQIELSMDPW